MWEVLQASSEPDRARVFADFYWRTLIVSALLCGAFSVWYGFSEFQHVSSAIEGATVNTNSARTGLDRAKLDETIKGFTERAERYKSLKDTPLSVPNPR